MIGIYCDVGRMSKYARTFLVDTKQVCDYACPTRVPRVSEFNPFDALCVVASVLYVK